MKSLSLISSLALTLAACSSAPPQQVTSSDTEQQDPESGALNSEELNVLSSTLWLPDAQTGYSNIPVCWETGGSEGLKEVVRQAVAQTWEKAARVTFQGWGDCAGGSDGIRIKLEDTGPHVTHLGSSLAGRAGGMVLNFTFKVWTGMTDDDENPVPYCEKDENLQTCIKGIAVHEFGHALGMPHEQNRPDNPSEDCEKERQGTDGDLELGEFDWDSVMNYCNRKWNNNGALSAIDRERIADLYGGVTEVQDPNFACFIPPCPTVPADVDGGSGLLHYGDTVAIGDRVHHYLGMDGDGDVRSDSSEIQGDERWLLVNPDDPNDRSQLDYGDRVALQGSTSAFMTARSDGSIPSWGEIGGPWEAWTILSPGNANPGSAVDATDPIVFYSEIEDGYVYHDFGNPRLTSGIGFGEVWYMRGPLN
jgi:hypothetical protein